jgi:hypothetical protein
VNKAGLALTLFLAIGCISLAAAMVVLNNVPLAATLAIIGVLECLNFADKFDL